MCPFDLVAEQRNESVQPAFAAASASLAEVRASERPFHNLPEAQALPGSGTCANGLGVVRAEILQ